MADNASAFQGGAFTVAGPTALFRADRSVIEDNRARNQSGALAVLDGATVQFYRSTLRANGAEFTSAIWNQGGNVELIASAVVGHTVNNGPGVIYNEGILSVENTTVAANEAVGFTTGLVLTNAASGVMIITNSTVTGNTQVGITRPGAVTNGGGLVIVENSILAENQHGDCTGVIVSLGHNIIGDPTATNCMVDLRVPAVMEPKMAKSSPGGRMSHHPA